MYYIKLFKKNSEYETYINGDEALLPNISFCKNERDVHYNPYDYSRAYFTFVVTSGGDITWTGKSTNALSYSTDDGATWSTASSNISLSVNAGDKVLWKGVTTPQSYQGIGTFSGNTDVRYSVEGNVMSLLFGDDFKGQTSLENKVHAFYGLFNGNTNVTSAENLSLPTTLAFGCYQNMFNGSTSLTMAPELTATTLADKCYFRMFYGCTSLTTAPELPATTLASDCYNNMFSGCTNLNTITCLATDISATNCTSGWVYGVASSGTFTKAASMSSWTTDQSGIPHGWTVVDA